MSLRIVRSPEVEEFFLVAEGTTTPVSPTLAQQATYEKPGEGWNDGYMVTFPGSDGQQLQIFANADVQRVDQAYPAAGAISYQNIGLSRFLPGHRIGQYIVMDGNGNVFSASIAADEVDAFIRQFRDDMHAWLGGMASSGS